jgi:hypothetical protein
MDCPWRSHALSPELDNSKTSIEALHSSGGGGENRPPLAPNDYSYLVKEDAVPVLSHNARRSMPSERFERG